MPSEHRIQRALEVLAAPRETFRSAVAAAVDQVGSFLDSHRAPVNGRAERTAHELGAFAAGRLDPNRFASFFGEADTLDPLALARMERAYETLSAVAGRGSDLFMVRVAPGADLRTQVGRALAEIGRAFGAARAVALARQGRHPAEEQDDYVGGFAFRKWNRAERQIAPPLVVEVEGADLQVGSLAEFLDGTLKLVLVVRGPAPAAALVRLVTPGVFVMQTTDEAELAMLRDVPGPGVVALVPEGAARFVHAPADAPVWDRIRLLSLPEDDGLAAVGSFSAFQQRDEVAQLRALAARPAPVAEPALPTAVAVPVAEPAPEAVAGRVALPAAAEAPAAEAAPAADRLAALLLGRAGFATEVEAPVAAAPPTPETADRLAAWLLSQTDLGRT